MWQVLRFTVRIGAVLTVALCTGQAAAQVPSDESSERIDGVQLQTGGSAVDKTAQRRRLGKEGRCDLCNTQVGPDAVCLSPTEFRAAAQAGLRPPKSMRTLSRAIDVSQEDFENGWLRAVLNDSTDWACCDACARRVEEYSKKRNTTNSPQDEDGAASQQIASLAQLQTVYEEARRLQALGQSEKSLAEYEKALAIARDLFAEDLNTARIMNNAALVCMECGRYDRAQSLFEASLRITEKEEGPDHLDVANVLDNFGQLLQLMQRLDESLSLFNRSLNIRRSHLPPDHIKISESLNNLASAYVSLNKQEKALPLFQESLLIAEKAEGLEGPNVVKVLRNFGLAYRDLHNEDKALELLGRALRIQESRLPQESDQFLTTLEPLVALYLSKKDLAKAAACMRRMLMIREANPNGQREQAGVEWRALGAIYQTMNSLKAAMDCFRRSLQIVEAQYGPQHAETATVLLHLANATMLAGHYSEAESLFQRVLQIREKADAESLEVAETLANFAALYRQLARFSLAESFYLRALTIQRRHSEAPRTDVALTLNNLGVLYESMGRFSEAETALQQALRLLEDAKDDVGIAKSLNSLGILYATMGMHDRAESFLLRSLQLKVDNLGANDSSVAITLDNLGGLYARSRRPSEAEHALERALSIRKAMDPPDHPGIAITLGGLAQLAVNRAEYDRAEDFARRSIAISEAKLGEQHPTVAATLVILAHTYMARKRYEDAERCLTRSLGIRERYLSSDHPDLHVTLNYLADLFVLTGRNDQAIATADRSRRVLARHVRRILPLLAEPEQIEFLAPYGEVLEDHLSLAMMSPSDARVAELSAEWVLNGKAVVHEVLANRWRMARDQRDSSGVQLVEELIGVRAQLAAIDAEVGEGSIVDHDLIATLNDREQAIARQLGQTDVGCLAEHWASVEEVRATLPEDSVLVEIARFRRANYQTAKLEERRFAAWVIPPRGRGRVVLVDLGQAEPIEQAVRVVRQSFANAPSRIADNGESAAEDDCRRSLQVLADLIVDPLKDYLLPARQWIISPDGALWLVPWAALPLNEKQYALEKHQIRTVITGRNLVLPQVPAGTSPDMVLADPDFDLPLTKLQTATHGTGLADGLSRSPAQPRRVQPLGKRWTRLPGTAVEATAVAIELEKYSGSAPCVYTRDQAVESVVMNAHGPRVLAISTHGFFLEDQDSAGFSPADNLGQRGVFVAPERVPGKDPMSFAHQIENPLLRCGLVLAGANHGQEADSASDGDGLLTGLEIVGADLRGTDLVVLSACESAVGEVRDSEGVMGLRQAFQLAGARTVVATLWKIPDRDTTELIRAFFRHLSECHDAPESLRQGQLDVLQSRRSRNGAAHPFYWAAFTATGEPTRASSPTTPAHVTPAVQPSTAETALWHSFVLPVGIVLGVSLVTVAACCAGWCLTRSMSKRHN